MLCGTAYFLWYTYTGIGIPCLFYKFTGWQCPGCGISRMIISIVHLDFESAKKYNIVLFYLLPALSLYCVYKEITYIRTGKRKYTALENVAMALVVIILLAFGVIRNTL